MHRRAAKRLSSVLALLFLINLISVTLIVKTPQVARAATLIVKSTAPNAALNAGCTAFSSAPVLLTTDQRSHNQMEVNCDISAAASGLTLTVNTTNDLDDGNCDVAHCSLREAINASNTLHTPNTIIQFNIAGSGVRSIQIGSSGLPEITSPVTIDGTTQPGASCSSWPPTLLIELNGTNSGPAINGLNLSAGNSTVRGLVINRFSAQGIALSDGGGNHVECNFLGTDSSGTITQGNLGHGLFIYNSPNNIIGGNLSSQHNLISGNHGNGIYLAAINANGNLIEGNYIGTNVNGTAPLGNAIHGIRLINGINNTIGGTLGTTPGGACTGACNLISANGQEGIVLDSPINLVEGNFIGTDLLGMAALGNSGDGVLVGADNNTIGGTPSGSRNLISGNKQFGIFLVGSNGSI